MEKYKAALTSTLNSLIALTVIVGSLIILPIPGIDLIPAWVAPTVIGVGAALRTAVAWLNPKDPTFGVGSATPEG
jgi:hypothetical protein